MTKNLNRLTNLFLLLLSTLSLTALFIDSFQLQTEGILTFWIIGYCVLLWVAASIPRGFWIGMPLSAGLLYAAYLSYHADLGQAFFSVFDHVSAVFDAQIYHAGATIEFTDTIESHSVVVLFLAFPLAAYLIAALCSKFGRISLSLLVTIPLFAACIIVNGLPPMLASMGVILFWFLLFLSGGSYQPESSAGRTALCCFLPLCVLLGLLLWIHNPSNYVYDNTEAKLYERFEKLSGYFNLFYGPEPAGSQDPDSDPDAPEESDRSRFQNFWETDDKKMQLNVDYDYEQADLKVMEVYVEYSGKLYLRSRSFGSYTGKGWSAAEELNSGSSLPFTAFAAAAAAETVSREAEIHTFMNLDTLCLPYYAAVSTGSDAFAASEGQENYRIAYLDYRGDPANLQLPPDAAEAERAYRNHAHSYYTELPLETRRAALRLCQEAGIAANDPNLIQTIAAYVSGSAEYDLDTDPYPSDDYALYFLTEAHRGYCIHYATAAAVLYRSLGIPARVVDGFLIDAESRHMNEVSGGNAHAWVEVYQDGVGWIPVEVTGRAGNAPAEPEPSPTAEPEPEPSEEPAAPTEEPSSPDNPEDPETPGTEEPVEPSPAFPEDPQMTDSPVPDETDPQPAKRPFPWHFLLGLLLLLAALPGWYGLRRLIYRQQLRQYDGGKAAVAIWRYAEKVCAYGAEMPEAVKTCAEKAVFSNHSISREELKTSEAALLTLIGAVYPTLRPLQKFRFRFLQGLR